jgi:hypothetical protein
MIKFIKSFFAKKTPPVVEQPKVEKYVAPVTVAEPVVEPVPVPEVSNPIVKTMVITSEDSKNIVAAPAYPEKKKRKSNKPKPTK